MSVTKISKFKADYHTWSGVQIADGDIIDCVASLGHPADQVTIESLGGQSVIRLNVCTEVHARQDTINSWLPYGGFFTSPVLTDEVEDTTKDDIVIEAGNIWFAEAEIPVKDIKIQVKSSGMKITIT